MPLRVVLLLLFCVSAQCALSSNEGPTFRTRPRHSILSQLSDYRVVHVTSPHANVVFRPSQSNADADADADSTVRAQPLALSFNFSAFGHGFAASVGRNRELFGDGYYEERQAWREGKLEQRSSSKRLVSEADLCHYQGSLAGTPESVVAVSTCGGGFSGLLSAYGETFGMAPADRHLSPSELQQHLDTVSLQSAEDVSEGVLHVVYRIQDVAPAKDFKCGVHDDHSASSSSSSSSSSSPSSSLSSMLSSPSAMFQQLSSLFGAEKLSTDTTSPRVQALPDTLYVELLVVNDHERFLQKGQMTEKHSASVVNMIDALYRYNAFQPTVRVVLVAQVTWIVNDAFPITVGPSAECFDQGQQQCGAREVSADALLANFSVWKEGSGVPQHDNAHLFSGHDFQSSVLGLAYVSGMCSAYLSCGIDQVTYADAFSAAVIAHEMGHNFGMQHDSTGNECPVSGYIMNAAVDIAKAPTEFSQCSLSYFETFVSHASDPARCLYNVPSSTWGEPVCGNGFVEAGEQCDCPDKQCAGYDRCCDGSTCQLLPTATCSERGGCCENCGVVADGRVCRAARSSCDMEERCSGGSGDCPADWVVGAGTVCLHPQYGSGMCYAGDCLSFQRQCREEGEAFYANSGDSGSPFNSCPRDTQIALNHGTFCGALWCSNSGGTCRQLSTVLDGIPCDNNRQCLNGACVPSGQLNTDWAWQTSDWGECLECNAVQSREAFCSLAANASVVGATPLCSPAALPPITQRCINETLGCAYPSEVGSGKVRLAGVDVDRNLVIFVSLGVAAFVAIVMGGCYQMVTRKAPPPKKTSGEDDEDKGEDDDDPDVLD